MIFVPGRRTRRCPSSRASTGFDPDVGLYRFGFEFITSNPQYHVYAPVHRQNTRALLPRTAGFTFPSSVARSPGYCRTTIGWLDVPVR